MKRFGFTLFTGAFVLIAFSVSGCSRLMGDLRRDLDDSQYSDSGPTVGGAWSERGFLSESMGESGYSEYEERSSSRVGHAQRAPAAVRENDIERSDTWVSEQRVEENRRDSMRSSAEDVGEAEAEGEEVSFSSNANSPSGARRNYKNGVRATRSDFIDESRNEGSLWASDGQSNYYFSKNKVRGLGDILTIKLEDEVVRDFSLEIRRTLSASEREKEFIIAQEKINRPVQADQVQAGAAAPSRAPAGAQEPRAEESKSKETRELKQVTMNDVDLASAIAVKSGDSMMAEIVERYPNGNYKIRGTKRVPYKNGAPRLMTVIAVVRGSDIGEDDTINSGKLYEYRLEAIR